MSTDRVFREEDAIWWDAHVRGPQRYTYREMNEDYKGLSPFSNDAPASSTSNPQHVVVLDPSATLRVDVNWLNIIALVVVMLALVAVVAIFAAAAVVIVVVAAVVCGLLLLVSSK